MTFETEKKILELVGNVIPHGHTTHSKIYCQIAQFCRRIIDIEQQTLAGQFPDCVPFSESIENSGISWEIIDNLHIALSKALECYTRKKSPFEIAAKAFFEKYSETIREAGLTVSNGQWVDNETGKAYICSIESNPGMYSSPTREYLYSHETGKVS